MKSQSAMEYLMTYGWAILIIAIVLAALFELGIFNSANFAPRTPPGGCQIFRPQGPGTTTNLNLEGECNGELPQDVADFNNGYIITNINQNIVWTSNALTVSLWINVPSSACKYATSYDMVGLTSTSSPINLLGIMPMFTCTGGGSSLNPGFFAYSTSTGGGGESLGGPTTSINTWYNFAFVFNGLNPSSYVWDFYIDGKQVAQGCCGTSIILPKTGLQAYIGYAGCQYCGHGANLTGSLADVQMYNFSMSSNDITTIYSEGIGGAPIDIYQLIGWWPLNGNTNDYSGNQNNAVTVSNVIYTSGWTTGYTPG